MNNDLLLKYVSGRCTSREEERVKHWLNESSQNRKTMQEFKQILEVPPGKRIEVDTYKAWDIFSENHFSYQDTKINRISNGSSPNKRSGLRGLRHQRLQRTRVAVYTTVTAAVVLLAFLFYYVVGSTTQDVPPELVNQEITTEKGERTTVRLSDGTRIYLNAESRLTVSADYNRDKNRTVYLEGEAFFEVAPDKQRLFEVKTSNSITRVLGTKFNVNAYSEEEEVQVVVAEGKVAFGSAEKGGSPEVQLTRNQKGTVFTGGEIMASKVSDLDVYLDWSRGRLTFQDASVKEMSKRLERWFDIEVPIAEDVSSETRLLTGSFKDVPLSNVLHSIALSLDMDYRREGRTVIFEDG